MAVKKPITNKQCLIQMQLVITIDWLTDWEKSHEEIN